MKPIACIDFDGVIHSYTSGWKDIDVIADPPVHGAFDAIRRFQKDGWEVAIFSSRSTSAKGIAAMREWIHRWGLQEHEAIGCGIAWMLDLRFPQHKPAAMISIDDRAIQFTGHWDLYDPSKLREFKPWNKRTTAST